MSHCNLLTRVSASMIVTISSLNTKDDIKAGLQKVNLLEGDVQDLHCQTSKVAKA